MAGRVPETLAVDANIMVAAMMGGRTRDLISRIRRSGTDLLTVPEAYREVEEHLAELAGYVGAHPDQFRLALWSLPVRRVIHADYSAGLERAAALVGARDPDDAPLVALALAQGIPIWSNDRGLTGLHGKGIEVYTTRQVVARLESV